MEPIYQFIKDNPKVIAWGFVFINAIWIVFTYFNKQFHDRKIERLKHSLSLEKEEFVPLIQKLTRLEELSGEAKEIATSHKSIDAKEKLLFPLNQQLDQLSGQLSKYPKLMQAIRDLNQHCSIMIQSESHAHESCSKEILAFYNAIISESKATKLTIRA